MQAVKSIALQAASDAGLQIQEQIAWLYLRHLGGAEVRPPAAFHSLLTRGERIALPEPQGERERAMRAHPCTRSALLEAQFYDTINVYTGQFVMSDSRVPQALRRKMNERLALFTTQTTDTLTDRFAACIWWDLRRLPVAKRENVYAGTAGAARSAATAAPELPLRGRAGYRRGAAVRRAGGKPPSGKMVCSKQGQKALDSTIF